MKVASSAEMKDIDRMAAEEHGITGTALMERAGAAVSRRIKERFSPRKTLVVSGGGNNGGDGIVTARELFNSGWETRAIVLSTEDGLSPECLKQYRSAKALGVPVYLKTSISPGDLKDALIVDAIFGTGLSRKVTGRLSKAIELINESGSPVVSVDMPSGVSSDTGTVMGNAVRADFTVAFGLPKRGHLLHPGSSYTGALYIEDIGFPETLLMDERLMCELVDDSTAASLIPEREKYSHKGHYGHVLVVAGSRGKAGAALMSARASLRAGAGLVTIGVPSTLMDAFQSRATEEMLLPLPDTGRGTFSSSALSEILDFLVKEADVLAVGPAIGSDKETAKLMEGLLALCAAPMVIDADAINSIRGKTGLLRKTKAPAILTPHPGEMARLIGGSKGPDVEADRIGVAAGFSKSTGAYLVLKGVPTITASPEGRSYINPTGNPGMATAGSGDVLTGIIASFVGQGLSPLEACILGAYLHGLSGDISAAEKGEHSLIATDIIEALPGAFLSLRKKCSTS